MTESNENNADFLDSNFPKKCASCGISYENEDIFFSNTDPLMKGTYSDGPKDTVLAYRNCVCGSTLTLKLNDRRDYSEEGIKKRRLFRQRMEFLIENQGVSKDEALKMARQEVGLP